MVSVAAIASTTREKLERARAASALLAQFSTEEKNRLLLLMADAIEARTAEILRANEKDIAESNLSGSMLDRLLLDPKRIKEMADAVRDVAALPDPVNEVLAEWTRPNGLLIRKVPVPLGGIGIVYVSRPNVTVDAAVLAFKTGNAVVLRGGKEAAHSNQALVEILAAVPRVPPGPVELLDSGTRETVQELITARGVVDVVIPPGGPRLISQVMENAIVPVIRTGPGHCHIFVDESAALEMASRIVINAKTQRPSVCNAAEKLLVHSAIAAKFIPHMIRQLISAGLEVRGDAETCSLSPDVKPATEQDCSEEYLQLCMAVRVVSGVDEAIAHMNRYSTKHSESIVTANEANARKFPRPTR